MSMYLSEEFMKPTSSPFTSMAKLCFVPLLIGTVLTSSNATNPAVVAAKAAGAEFIPYNYTVPLIIFAGFGVAALLIALYLKALDSKRHLGLEEPNIK